MLEKLVRHRNDFIVKPDMIPIRMHQAQEEILQLEKDLASLIYSQKDLERGI